MDCFGKRNQQSAIHDELNQLQMYISFLKSLCWGAIRVEVRHSDAGSLSLKHSKVPRDECAGRERAFQRIHRHSALVG